MRAASGSMPNGAVNTRQSTPLLSHSALSTLERGISLVRARTEGSIEEEGPEKEPGESSGEPRGSGEWTNDDGGAGEDGNDEAEEEEGEQPRRRAISSGEGPTSHNGPHSNPQPNGTLPTIRLNSLPAADTLLNEPTKGKRSYFLLYREVKRRDDADKPPAANSQSQPNLPSTLPEWRVTERLRQLMETGPRRSFAKPYAAKTVFFFKDGDEYFTGLRVPVSKARFRTMDALLDTLNQGITLPFGVRRLHTPSGRTQVNSLEQLQHLGKYVASSSKVCRRPPPIEAMQAMEQRYRVKQHSRMVPPARLLASTFTGLREDSSIRSLPQPTSRRTHTTNLTFLPVQAKQMFFVLNGHPSRIHRALINPLKASPRGRSLDQQAVEKEERDFTTLLEDISHGLQVAIFRIYSFDGERILSLRRLLELKEARALAVPRNERPLINVQTHSDILFRRSGTDLMLPSIHNSTNSIASNTNTKTPSKTSSRSSSSSKQRKLIDAGGDGEDSGVGNSIERPANDFTGGRSRLLMRLQRTSPSLMSPLDEERENAKAPNFLGNDEAAPSTSHTLGETTRLPQLEGTLIIPQRRAVPANRKRKGQAVALAKKRSAAIRGANADERTSASLSSTSPLLQKVEEGDENPHGEETPKDDHHPNQSPPGILRAAEPNKGPIAAMIRSNSDSEITTTNAINANIASQRRASIEEAIFVREVEALELGKAMRSSQEGIHQMQDNLQATNEAISAAAETSDIPPEANGQLAHDEGALIVENVAVELEFKREEERRDVVKLRAEGELLKAEGPDRQAPQADGSSMATDFDEKDSQMSDNEMMRAPLTPQSHREPSNNETDTPVIYTITVVTGNRWAADTEADLHLTIYGEHQLVSEKIPLRQEHVNWLQLGTHHRFRQNQADSFRVELPTHFGVIQKILIGHENLGYGAGLFIDRVLVTEEENLASAKATAAAGSTLWQQNDQAKTGTVSGGPKQYLFACGKWFDSGQVDGRVERTLKLTAYADLNPLPPLTPTNPSDEEGTQENEPELVTKGRWELLLLVGKPQHAGSTSGLAVVGYGTSGQSKTIGLYDSRISEEGESSALIQVDFGDISALLKVRLEIDGAGAAPDLFLRWVEFKDLDTGERFTSICGKWLRWNSGQGAQPFRELSAFHIGIEPLSVITYDCRMHAVSARIPAVSSSLVHVEIYGDLGETGLLPISMGIERKTEDAQDVDFKLEAGSVGRVFGARIYFQPTTLGAEIYEGFIALAGIYKKHSLEFAESAGDWLVESIPLRESLHAPYRYLLRHSRVGNAHSSESDGRIMVKELLASEMEGVPTKARKKKGKKRRTPSFILSMLIGEGSTHYPDVTLCGKKGGSCATMTVLSATPSDWIISYQLKSTSIGELTKVRVSGNRKNQLLFEGGGEDLKRQKPETITAIHKIRLCDTENGDELRFPSANVELTPDSTYEFAAIWPDCAPTPIVNYTIKVPAVHSSVTEWNDSRVMINLHGEGGNTGFRLINSAARINTTTEGEAPTADANIDAFELEAVSIGGVLKVEARTDGPKAKGMAKVHLGEVVIVDATTAREYRFRLDGPLTSTGLVRSSERQLAN